MRLLKPVPCLLAAVTACAAPAPGAWPAPAPVEIEMIDAGGNSLRFDFMPERGVSADTIRGPARLAWGALPAAYAKFGLGVTSHRSARVVTSESSVRREIGDVRLSRMLACGSAMGSQRADTYTIRLAVATYVDSIGPATTILRTRVQATGRDASAGAPAVQCRTTGYLEQQIANAAQHLVR